ncbi:MAG: PmoA family protein [Tannerella sp.]|nr:PmoA family protein [Tannerella sp.]
MNKMILLCLLVGGFAVGGLQGSGQVDSPFHWETSDCRIALKHGEQTVWRFNADMSDASKPYFDPLCTVGGPSLTLPKPADHPWHLAHWFSWKYINGVNYWETDQDGRAQGETYWEAPEWEPNRDGSARIVIELGYRLRNETNKTLLHERREIVISAPASDGSYRLDWTQQFTAQEEALLDRTPIPGEENASDWGGYAGLAIRFSNELKEVATVTTKPDSIRNRTSGVMDIYGATAAEQNGTINGQEYGIAILSHPATPRNNDWYIIMVDDFTYLNPATLLRGKYLLNKGAALTLRHRVHVHKGRWNTEQLNEAAEEFAVDFKKKTSRRFFFSL